MQKHANLFNQCQFMTSHNRHCVTIYCTQSVPIEFPQSQSPRSTFLSFNFFLKSIYPPFYCEAWPKEACKKSKNKWIQNNIKHDKPSHATSQEFTDTFFVLGGEWKPVPGNTVANGAHWFKLWFKQLLHLACQKLCNNLAFLFLVFYLSNSRENLFPVLHCCPSYKRLLLREANQDFKHPKKKTWACSNFSLCLSDIFDKRGDLSCPYCGLHRSSAGMLHLSAKTSYCLQDSYDREFVTPISEKIMSFILQSGWG